MNERDMLAQAQKLEVMRRQKEIADRLKKIKVMKQKERDWVPPRRKKGGGDGGSDPLDPLNASVPLLAWYDFSDNDTLTLTGSDIDQIDDKSVHGNHASQTNASLKPVIASLNGHQWCRQTNNGGKLFKNDAVGTPELFDNLTEFSIYFVTHIADSESGAKFSYPVYMVDDSLGSDHLQTQVFINRATTTTGIIRFQTGTQVSEAELSYSRNETYIGVGTLTGVITNIKLNSNEDSGSADVGPEAVTRLDICYTVGTDTDFYVGEILVFNGILTSSENERLLTQLQDKWL